MKEKGRRFEDLGEEWAKSVIASGASLSYQYNCPGCKSSYLIAYEDHKTTKYINCNNCGMILLTRE